VRAFDTLDGADAFVHPDAMAAVAASNKRAEHAALDEVVDIVAAAARRWDTGGTDDQGLFGRIVDAWCSEAQDNRFRGIALDVALIHIASMSNLAAALGWALIDLLEHPEHLARVVAADADLAQRCALESTRLAQRSIMSRTVLSPVRLDTGEVSYQVPPGWTIATLLPLLNTSVAPGLENWDPDRWTRHRLTDEKALPSPMLVTAFGHGRHSCPAQPFSLSAMTAAMTHLCGRYQMTPDWTTHPRPVPAQIGGVARADGQCVLHYLARLPRE
jgi:cytochrome P450